LFSVPELAEELFGFADGLCILEVAIKNSLPVNSRFARRVKLIAAQSAKGVDDAGAEQTKR
jgi:hypothetical protein